MASLSDFFKAGEIESAAPAGDFAVIPAGWYLGYVENAEIRDSKAGKKMLTVTYALIDEDYEGRKFFNNFVLEGTEDMLRTVKSKLSALRIACELPLLNDHAALIDCVLSIKIGIKAKTDQYDESNKVDAVANKADLQSKRTGGRPGAAPQQARQVAQPPARPAQASPQQAAQPARAPQQPRPAPNAPHPTAQPESAPARRKMPWEMKDSAAKVSPDCGDAKAEAQADDIMF